MSSFIQNTILQILKDGQERRTGNIQRQQQQEQFDVNKELKLKELEDQQAEHQRQYDLQKANADLMKTVHSIDILSKKGDIVNQIAHGMKIPGVETQPSSETSQEGYPQQRIVLPNDLGEVITLTPESTKTKEDQAQRIAQEIALAQKVQETMAIEDAKLPSELKKIDAKSAADATRASVLEDQRAKHAMEREQFTAKSRERVAFARAAAGNKENADNIMPWVNDIADFKTDDKELKFLKKDGEIVADTAKSNGFKIPTEKDREQLKNISTLSNTFDNVARLLDSTPSRPEVTGPVSLVNNAISMGGQYFSSTFDDKVSGNIKDVDAQAGAFAKSLGGNVGATGVDDARRAFATLTSPTASKEAKARSADSLRRTAKVAIDTILAPYHPTQRQAAYELYGLNKIVDVKDFSAVDAAIKAKGGK